MFIEYFFRAIKSTIDDFLWNSLCNAIKTTIRASLQTANFKYAISSEVLKIRIGRLFILVKANQKVIYWDQIYLSLKKTTNVLILPKCQEFINILQHMLGLC